MDTTRHFQLLQLLDGLTANDWLADDTLRYRLAPIIAKTAEEQRRFYDFFDQLEAAWVLEAEERATPIISAKVPEKWSKKLTTSGLFALLTIALAFISWFFFSPTKKETTFDLAIAKETIPTSLKVNAVVKLGDNQQITSDEEGIINYDYTELIPQLNGIGQLSLEVAVNGYSKKTCLLELFTTSKPMDTILLERLGLTIQIRKGKVLDRQNPTAHCKGESTSNGC